MINFIVCDDVIKYRQMIEKIIDKYMMKNKLEYKTYIYNDYDEDFMKMVSSKLPFKVYILDIETPTKSGIDIARIIRHKDINSILIFITGHQELDRIVMKNDFLFLAFINKFDNCEERLMNALDKSLKLFQIKKVIKFKDNGIMYSIPLDDILYITRDSIDRKCIIVTDYSEFRVSKNLNEIEGMVNANFIKTHRACLINKKR
ncbi:MAG: LytTR family transcriptional regulator DNA-binding domain-containing protein, partial [Bacilli bacterium]|nr:LytTR family transcriptional regulator DNA-binding domain-containing protein [Bacilli bacterium]